MSFLTNFNYASALADWQVCGLMLMRSIYAGAVLVCARTPNNLKYYPVGSQKRDVLNIVLDAFPEPDSQTSWEQIVEFRQDSSTKAQMLALRRWVVKVARENLSEKEISQEIEWLLNEYQAHMRLHRMKITTGTLETVVVTVAEVAENLAKLKFGALAKSLFVLQHRSLELAEAERQAPGRELAYISRAREHFGPASPLSAKLGLP